MLPKDLAKHVPRNRLMTEGEWRRLGVQQSQGWIHYMIHTPGLCFSVKTLISIYSQSYTRPIPLQTRGKGLVIARHP